MRYAILGVLFALPLVGGGLPIDSSPKVVVLRDSAGQDVGRVSIREHGQRIQIRVKITGLPAGLHGMHLHEAGLCQGPRFESAGGHLNPGGLMHHGQKNPQGPHLGDLGNISVGKNYKGNKSVEVGGAEARAGMKTFLGLGQRGLALVIHANRDDEMTDPSGNSGARIACAELTP
jgi:Cu-Zn family superoxide dismutase